MSRLTTIDMMLINQLFESDAGYVLNFSNKTFAEFFANDLFIDIYDPKYERSGTSKMNRLRCFLQTIDAPTAVRTLRALWSYREAMQLQFGKEEKVPNAHARLLDLIGRLEGNTPTPPPTPPPLRPDAVRTAALRNELMQLHQLAPQPRGYAFERFLKGLFDVYGMEAREAFRLVGEQIDGSFQLAGETYLVEAKWQNEPTGVADLHVFHGKVEQKAAWSRGLFISYNGFTEDGLVAFGRGKRVVCMEGLDLYEILNNGFSLTDLITLKVRRAAETGRPFVPYRELGMRTSS